MTQIAKCGQSLTPDTFRWKTMGGQVLRLGEMETSHLFNCMKMLFNHIVASHGGDPVWFQKKYSDYRKRGAENPTDLAVQLVFFYQEIERRGDLPDKYRVPYAQIVNQLRGIRRVEGPQEVRGFLAGN